MTIRWWLRGQMRLSRCFWPDVDEWLALEAYRGLVTQAFSTRPLRPMISSQVWNRGDWSPPDGSLRSPSRRERENASHHYGHDIQLKRHAGMPLVGRPFPLLLEHGLKVSREAGFEQPRPWSRGYLCMGPLRAQWLTERYQQQTHAIGPWIAYARPVLDQETIQELREQLGSTLLVVLAHSWGAVERHNDLPTAIQTIQQLCDERGYRSVIWLRHWQDSGNLSLPDDWIQACNGHRSNPWFLDALRTLLELCDGLASNSFGTHLGYAMQCNKTLHWLEVASRQDLSALPETHRECERIEWQRRQELGLELRGCSEDPEAVRTLLDPYWGFSQVKKPETLARFLQKSTL